jgi:hypothetical protein
MTHALRLVMQRRRIPVLDALFDRISMLLWPRFKQVFDANLKSIKNANAKKLGPVDVSPHYVSRCGPYSTSATIWSGLPNGVRLPVDVGATRS